MPDYSSLLSKTESELFATINRAFDIQKSQRWQELIELRNAETVEPQQLEELVGLGNEFESITVQRFQAIHELAKLRGVDFQDLCRQLDIAPQ